MNQIYYQPQNGWVGDLIPFSHDGKFYLYYLHDKRKGKTMDEYGFGTSWNLLVTTDGTDIQDMGVALAPGTADDIDESCYTGSVIQGKDGVFHLFYTAQNTSQEKYIRDGKPMQYVMQATSRDLIHWEKHYDTVFGADESRYEVFDWRDPYVFYNEEENCYNMLLAARLNGADKKCGGCIALCRSKDLWSWEICEPYYNPKTYMTHECPDVFQIGEWHYLVYSTFSERFVTHYRMSRSANGPWTAPVEDSFDGRGFYAAKTAELDGERWAFAWVPSKRCDEDFGQWEWGGALVMHKLFQQPDGRLTVNLPPAIAASFSKRVNIKAFESCACDYNKTVTLDAEYAAAALWLRDLPEHCIIEADMAFSSGIRNFGIGIRQSEDYADGYFFRLEPFYNRVVFDLWPRRVPGVNQWYLDGDKPFVIELERPYRMVHLRSVHVKLVIDGDICVFYVDESVALTTRTYSLTGTGWSFFAFDGTITLSNICLWVNN